MIRNSITLWKFIERKLKDTLKFTDLLLRNFPKKKRMMQRINNKAFLSTEEIERRIPTDNGIHDNSVRFQR